MAQTKNQQFVSSMFIGILLYSVVLGFFNDYTHILQTSSYSITFLLAIVLQLLTYVKLALKDVVKAHFSQYKSKAAKYGFIFSVWFILFVSKFIFLAVIDFIFRDQVEISGFFGLMAMVFTLIILQKISELIYKKLGTE